MSSLGKLMKQAARMQQQMEQIQTSLAQRTVEATSGGGAVKVVAKCDGTLASIKINPQALNPADAQASRGNLPRSSGTDVLEFSATVTGNYVLCKLPTGGRRRPFAGNSIRGSTTITVVARQPK